MDWIWWFTGYILWISTFALREKCPNTEFFMVHIFLYLNWIGDLRSRSPYSVRMQENTDLKKTVFWHFSCSPNTENSKTEKTPHWNTSYALLVGQKLTFFFFILCFRKESSWKSGYGNLEWRSNVAADTLIQSSYSSNVYYIFKWLDKVETFVFVESWIVRYLLLIVIKRFVKLCLFYYFFSLNVSHNSNVEFKMINF